MNTFLLYIALWWWLAEGHSLHTILLPPHDLEKIDAQWGIWTVAFGALSVNCCGLGHREDSGHIALVNDWWHLQDLWSLKVVPLLKSHKEGNKSWAESYRNGHRRDSSLSHRSCCWELPWTAALCDTFFAGQLSACDRSHVLKCSQVW